MFFNSLQVVQFLDFFSFVPVVSFGLLPAVKADETADTVNLFCFLSLE